jgi:hypothetical protein
VLTQLLFIYYNRLYLLQAWYAVLLHARKLLSLLSLQACFRSGAAMMYPWFLLLPSWTRSRFLFSGSSFSMSVSVQSIMHSCFHACSFTLIFSASHWFEPIRSYCYQWSYFWPLISCMHVLFRCHSFWWKKAKPGERERDSCTLELGCAFLCMAIPSEHFRILRDALLLDSPIRLPCCVAV